jgi:hypothetical protein
VLIEAEAFTILEDADRDIASPASDLKANGITSKGSFDHNANLS